MLYADDQLLLLKVMTYKYTYLLWKQLQTLFDDNKYSFSDLYLTLIQQR
jgi:hypothetical protein